jgi:hypothetical protein
MEQKRQIQMEEEARQNAFYQKKQQIEELKAKKQKMLEEIGEAQRKAQFRQEQQVKSSYFNTQNFRKKEEGVK